jgi:predicted amidohydrolase
MAQRQQAEVSRGQESHTVRVGLLQTAPRFGAVEENLADIAELHDVLDPVDLAFTPELSVSGYGFAAYEGANQITVDDDRLNVVTAKGIGVGFAEKNNSGLPWNSYLLTDPVTGARHLQRKLHPVSYAPWNEHRLFQAGQESSTTDMRGGRIATVICNDMWHPAVPWLVSRSGAEVLIVPVASAEGADPARIKYLWQVILEHTAILLQCYVVFVNRCGTDGGATFWGGSRVLNPDGSVLTSLGTEAAAAVAELDLTALRRLRAEVPLLTESRSDFLAEALARGPRS